MFPRFTPPEQIDWVIMNPPFNKALEFQQAARSRFPDVGIAMLLRTSWMESKTRYREIFSDRVKRPSHILVSTERISMVKGVYDPGAGLATSYSWFVWDGGAPPVNASIQWIPPGGRKRFFQQSDTLIGKDT